jgi:hypothetical protein
MFYWIKVRTLSWPIVNITLLVTIQPGYRRFYLVLWVIIMLKVNVGPVEIIVFHSITKGGVQIMLVNIRINASIVNLAVISWSFACYTASHHQLASSMLDCKFQVTMLKKTTWPFPIVVTTIGAPYIDLSFIKEYRLLSVIHCLILMIADTF